LIAHILYYFSRQKDLVFDPMGGGGVTPDVCLAFNRRCWTLDMIDRPDARPEIEPYYWDIKGRRIRPKEHIYAVKKGILKIL
jgi:DNA modification methylase